MTAAKRIAAMMLRKNVTEGELIEVRFKATAKAEAELGFKWTRETNEHFFLTRNTRAAEILEAEIAEEERNAPHT